MTKLVTRGLSGCYASNKYRAAIASLEVELLLHKPRTGKDCLSVTSGGLAYTTVSRLPKPLNGDAAGGFEPVLPIASVIRP